MKLHLDLKKHNKKPAGPEVGGIKARFTKPDSIMEMTAQQIAEALIRGCTIQPGVTPFSEKSRQKGCRGTVKEDFAEQTLFMVDIDNKRSDVPPETPEHVAAVLEEHHLKAAFMYDTFGSNNDTIRFRFGLVASEAFIDKEERDRVQAGLISLFPQADADCVNADRIFFGTDKGLLEEFTDYQAVCCREDLLAIAQRVSLETEQSVSRPMYGQTIPTGQRHGTLVSFAATVLKKYGITDMAFDAFMARAAQCEEPNPEAEIKRIWQDACKYYEKTISAQPGYIPPDEYAFLDFEDSLEPTDYTDVGQANVFTAHFGDRVKYTPATKFIVYSGTVWQESEIKAQGLSQELTEMQLEDARERVRQAQVELNAAIESGNGVGTAKQNLARQEKYREYVLRRRKTDKIKATLTEARPKVEIDVSALDADGYLLNTPAGTVDLRTGEMKPHDPDNYCTKITTVAPDGRNADTFAEFMKRVTVEDADLERYLQEVAGMCAVGRVLRENLIIAYGEGGNGKSTLFNLLSHVLGDYSGSLSAETLTANCRKNKSPEYAELRGKRLVIAAELEEGMRLDTAIVKKLCSTDPILAEKKYKDPFSFVPSHTVVLYTNHLPKIGTTDKGTWDRIIAVPFRANFRGMKGEVKNYADYLYDQCGGAVLSWIIEGARRFIANDYNIAMPDCVRRAIEQYKANNDWLDNFLSECCEVDRMYTERSGKLYACYRSHCDGTGDYRRSLADFKQALTCAGFKTIKTKTGAIVHGLRIASEFEGMDDDKPPFAE